MSVALVHLNLVHLGGRMLKNAYIHPTLNSIPFQTQRTGGSGWDLGICMLRSSRMRLRICLFRRLDGDTGV